MYRRSRHDRNRSRTPPGQGFGTPATIKPAARKLLREMTPQERRDWFAIQQAELEDFCSFAQTYVKRREGSGRQTQTDERYNRFFNQAADLINGLAEMRELAAETAEAQKEGPDL